MDKTSTEKPTRRFRFQFSIRFLLIFTVIVALLTGVGVTVYQKQVVKGRPMRFIQAIKNGDIDEVDRILKIDPQLAHGRQYGDISYPMTPLQLALMFSRKSV